MYMNEEILILQSSCVTLNIIIFRKYINSISFVSVKTAIDFSPSSEITHAAGTSINFVLCEEIRKIYLAFTMVVYEKIFGSIDK